MKRKTFFHLVLPITILVVASLACNAVTSFFDEESDPYTPEEPVPLEPPVKEEPAPAEPLVEDQPLEQPPAESLFCPAVTDNILEVATEFYEDDS
ncbi:MAG: hypothetical protein GY852_02740, partial [bacterium]|nr:hypothetical protein [bacterium]